MQNSDKNLKSLSRMNELKFPQLIIIMHIQRLGVLWILGYHGHEWNADQSFVVIDFIWYIAIK